MRRGHRFLVPPHNFSKFNAVSDNPVYYGRITRPIRSAMVFSPVNALDM